ncbi:MAG TPA: LCP family protein [Acidimicrobiales bacterium]|nr:LCP family protein [Acidimicrobiales bacterium]
MATPGQGAGCAHVAGTARHNGRASAQSEAAYVPLPTTSEPVDARHQATQTAGTSRSVPDLRRRVLVGLAAAVALLASLAGASVGYVAWRLGQVPRVQVPGLSARVGQPYDILIAGSDSRAGLSPAQQAHFGNTQVTAGQRSDVIMVLRVNTGTRKAALLSIPRDLYVPMPGTGRRDRINAALNDGPGALVAAVQQDLGIPVNHYASVDFNGFQGLVDAVGGIDLYFPFPARDTMSGLDVPKAGCTYMNGAAALALARSRYYQYFEGGAWHYDGTGDLGRIQRQHTFVRVLLAKAVSSGLRNPITANTVVADAVKDVTMDDKLGLLDALRLLFAGRSLGAGQIPTYTLPTSPAVVGGADVLLLQNSAADQVKSAFMASTQPASSPSGPSAPSPSEVQVKVLNGSGVPGQAAEAAAALRAAGFRVAGTGDASSFAYQRSVVLYPPGAEARARLLASFVGGATAVRLASGQQSHTLVLVTGSGFSGVRAPAPGGPAAPSQPPSFDPRPC